MIEKLLAALGQAQPHDSSPLLTPDLLNSIKQIQGGSADLETNNIIQSILSVHSASNGTKITPAAPALTASAVDQLPTPSTSAPSTASGSGSRSGDMGPPQQDDAAARLRRLTAGKGKENAPLSSGGGAGSDATMVSATSSGGKKRKAIEQEEGCENCGATKSFAWRRKEGSGKVCNGASSSNVASLSEERRLTSQLVPFTHQLAASTGTATRASGRASSGASPSLPSTPRSSWTSAPCA